VREAQAVKADAGAAPLADRAFGRTERMVVRGGAYAPGGQTPDLSARLLNRSGQAMADVPVQADGSEGIIDLALSPLAAGDYLVEINAKTSSGTAQELVAFKVIR
jgi:hypothetical protein